MKLNKTLKHFKVLTATAQFNSRIAHSDLKATPLQARLVYSWLAHRSRLGLGASARAITREIVLHPKTVATTLNSLGDLVERRGNEWIAVEPPDKLFVPMRLDDKPKHWADRLAYTMLYLPRRGAKIKYPKTSRKFGMNHALIWSYLFRKAKDGVVRRFTFAGAAALFGINAKTVASIITDLLWLRMIDREDLGGSSDITLLAITEDHLALFEPKQKQERKRIEPVEKLPRSPAPYQLRGDRWDICRKLCEGLIAQKWAEEAINKAQRLSDTPEDFENQFLQAKGYHDKNLQSGKVGKGNFAKYLNACYDTRISKLEEQERAEEARVRMETYYLSDEYRAKQKEIEKNAAADPMHRRHIISNDSILDRVCLHDNPFQNFQEAEKVSKNIFRHVKLFVDKKQMPTQDEIDLKSKLHGRILKEALSTLNSYYQQETRATAEEFQQAIDTAIIKVEPQMGRLHQREGINV